MKTNSMKRIHKVTIKRTVDDSPDTSWLGEYSNDSASDYSIDRKHSLDCPINTGLTALELKTRTLANVHGKCECADPGCSHHEGISECKDTANTIIYRVDMEDSSGTLMCDDCANDETQSGLFVEADDPELEEPQCDCGESGDAGRNEYRYFNPCYENYKGLEDSEIRKYCQQDYERMESLNRGDWCFLGLSAESEIVLGNVCQTITSGGLWGIESDSGSDYFAEIEQEQLAELREQLHAIGFSKRAISAAFKSVERSE